MCITLGASLLLQEPYITKFLKLILEVSVYLSSLQLGTSPADSIDSDFNDVFDGLTTDSDDPLHEQSILEELFYKGQVRAYTLETNQIIQFVP